MAYIKEGWLYHDTYGINCARVKVDTPLLDEPRPVGAGIMVATVPGMPNASEVWRRKDHPARIDKRAIGV